MYSVVITPLLTVHNFWTAILDDKYTIFELLSLTASFSAKIA